MRFPRRVRGVFALTKNFIDIFVRGSSVRFGVIIFLGLAMGACAYNPKTGQLRLASQSDTKPGERWFSPWDLADLYSGARFCPTCGAIQCPECGEWRGGYEPDPRNKIGDYYRRNYAFGISGAFTSPETTFIDRGKESGNGTAICADGTVNLWNVPFAASTPGGFSGLRIGATGSLCQGFGTATEPVDGFDGRTKIGTFATFGGRVSVPLNLNGFRVSPYAGAGGAYARVSVEAFPFESNSSWRWGNYWEAGIMLPVNNPPWGTGTVQSIDQAAMELYVAYKKVDVGSQTLSGGARTNTDFGMVLVGAQIKY